MPGTRLRSYEPTWPALLIRERDRAVASPPAIIVVEHFGSTAVSGVEAKPVVDMTAGRSRRRRGRREGGSRARYKENLEHGMAGAGCSGAIGLGPSPITAT